MTYEYDDWGNLTAKSVYPYTTAENPGTPTDTKTYDYDNTQWGDQLTGYDGQTIEYEPVYGIRGLLLGYAGNPISYLGKTMSWHGRELVGVSDGTDTISYVYDSNGLRQKKTVNGTDTNYYYNGSVLIGMQQGTNALRFSYDAAGAVAAVDFNGTYYYYVRNGQGDIVKLIDGSRNTVVEYAYDSWGKLLSCTGTLATSLGSLNPFRYRGYVYDQETGFYYLKSRYYDPETCRFISADVLLSTGQGVLGHNCYAYCLDNPVNRSDNSGHSSRIADFIDCGGGDTPGGGSRNTFYFDIGEEQQAIDAFKEGKDVYYGSAHLSLIKDTNTFRASFTIFSVIHFHPYQINVETLKHEYGHILQERVLGMGKYIQHIALPSVIYNLMARKSAVLSENYFNTPWEKGADILGRIENREGDAVWSYDLAILYFAYSILVP